MKLNDSTLAYCTETNKTKGQKDYYVGLPASLCHALNLSPGVAPAWLLFLDYGCDVKSKASRYRFVVFPYHPPDLQFLYRVRAKMENLPGAMFVVSWLLEELCCFNFLATTGIDSVDNCGMIDAICSLSGAKLRDRYAVEHLSPEHVSYFIHFLTKDLKDTAAGILAYATEPLLADYLRRSAIQAMRAVQVTPGGKPGAFSEAARDWLEFTRKLAEHKDQTVRNPIDLLPVMFPAPHAAAPTVLSFAKDGTPDTSQPNNPGWPLLRIEHSFSNEDSKAGENSIPRTIAIEPCTCEKDCSSHYRLPVPYALARNLTDYLPQDYSTPCDAGIAFDLASRSLSVHLKPRQEVHTRFVVIAKPPTTSPTLARVALNLFLHGADLRTLTSHHSDVSDHIEFTADMKSSDAWLKLVDENFAGPLLLKLKQFGEFEDIIVGRRPSPSSLSLEDINYKLRSDHNTAILASAIKNATISNEQKTHLLAPKQTIAQYRDKKVMLVVVRTIDRIAWAELSNIGRDSNRFVDTFSAQYRLAAPFGPIIVRALYALLRATEGQETIGVDLMKRLFSREAVQMLEPILEPAQPIRPTRGNIGHRSISVTNERTPTIIDVTFVKRLGGGQNGEVWKVSLSQPVLTGVELYALKLLDNTQAWEETGVNSSHVPPDTVPRYCAVSFDDDANPAVLMELLAGHDLQSFFESRSHSITIREILVLLLRTADLIERWELANLLHWDIKPANLFLCDDKRLLFIDLGLITKLQLDTNGKKSSSANIERAKKSSTDKFLGKFGTAYHVAPEIGDLEPTGPATPIYSWGALACCLLGDQAYLEPRGRPTAPIWISDLLGSEFADTIAGCLGRSPEGRPLIADIKRVVQQVIDANLISDCLFVAEDC